MAAVVGTVDSHMEDTLVVLKSGDHCPQCGVSNTINEKITVTDIVGSKQIIACRKCSCGEIYLTKRLKKLLPATVKYIEVEGEKNIAKSIQKPKTVNKHKSGQSYVINMGKVSKEEDPMQQKCPICGSIGLFGGKGMCWECYKDMMGSRFD